MTREEFSRILGAYFYEGFDVVNSADPGLKGIRKLIDGMGTLDFIAVMSHVASRLEAGGFVKLDPPRSPTRTRKEQ